MGADQCANNTGASSSNAGFQISDSDMDRLVHALGSRFGSCKIYPILEKVVNIPRFCCIESRTTFHAEHLIGGLERERI